MHEESANSLQQITVWLGSLKFKSKLVWILKHHEFQIQMQEESQEKTITRTISPLAILLNLNRSDKMEKEARQALLYTCFDIEKSESQVKR